MKKQLNNLEIWYFPIAVVDQADYGMMNGEKVLKSAIKLIKSNKIERTSLMMKKLEKKMPLTQRRLGEISTSCQFVMVFLFQLHY